jgi:hypothetical protein
MLIAAAPTSDFPSLLLHHGVHLSSIMSSDTEKHAAEHVDQVIGEVSIDASVETYTPEEQKKIIRRVDRRRKGNGVP